MQEFKIVDDGRHRGLVLGKRAVGDDVGRYMVVYSIWFDGQQFGRLWTVYSMKAGPAKMRAEP